MGKRPDWVELEKAASDVVGRTIRALPELLRLKVNGIPVMYARYPGKDLRRGGVEPDTMGLFIGEALPDPEGSTPVLSPHVLLFLGNILDEAGGDVEAFRDEVKKTLLHEIGHYLGLDELELEDRGLE